MTPRYRTNNQERSEQLEAERAAPFRHTHTYQPIGWDVTDPKVHRGEAILPGSRVEKVKSQLRRPSAGRMSFVDVRDEFGNHQAVAKASLGPKSAYTGVVGTSASRNQPPQETETSPDAMHWSPAAGDAEIEAWHGIFNDRRGRG